MSIRPRVLLWAGLVAALCSARALPAGAQDHPRLGLYGSIMGDGYPFLTSLAGPLDTAAVAAIARYHTVILDVNPVTPYRPDLVAELRRRNPSIRLLGYVLGHDIWAAADPDSLNHYPTRYRRLVRDLDGFLHNRLNGQYYPGANVNLAKRDGQGRFVVAEGLADLFHDAVVATGQWDGVFIDVFCHSLAWTQDGTRQVDYQRAGYASLAAFDAAWTAGADTLARRLRRLSGDGPVLCGNCGPSAHFDVFHGWMRENFPWQGGGDWYRNLLDDPHGYLADERDYRQAPHNWIFSALSGTAGQEYSAENARKVRFGLASASLGNGYGVFGPSDRVATTAPYHLWWYDEYAVDRATGRASDQLAHTGWLGAASGAPYQMIWAGTNPDAVGNPGFEASATSGWNFASFAPASATRSQDLAAGAPVGAAALRIAIASGSSVDWHVNLATEGTLSVVPWQSYSLTFWGRAVPAREVPVLVSKPGGGSVASRTVSLTPEWKQHQIVLQPSESAQSSLVFYLARGGAGDVWLDDVHFQQGATNLWRRDFSHGIVLLNPSDQTLQVPLAAPFRRILGTVAPAINDGQTVQSVTVGPSDALFLLRGELDTTPPAAILDMRHEP
jgi:hypothetical protein